MKHIILTGGSGGIGGAVAKRFLDHGWHTHLLLRSLESPAVQELMKYPNISVYKSDPEDEVSTMRTIQSIKNDRIVPGFVFHCAGIFLWDSGAPKELRPFAEVRDILYRSNVKTKEPLVNAIDSVYGDSLSEIEQGFVGSHAWRFVRGGPERTGGPQTQEAYVECMQAVQQIYARLATTGRYRGIFLYEPGFTGTGLMDAFTEELLGFTPDPSTVMSAEERAIEMFPESFFTARQ
jgi:NAD(P)-dependent dehydrogenase (short-subunit alcohol dehydrogenase family)